MAKAKIKYDRCEACGVNQPRRGKVLAPEARLDATGTGGFIGSVETFSPRPCELFIPQVRLIESGWQLIVERCQIEVRGL